MVKTTNQLLIETMGQWTGYFREPLQKPMEDSLGRSGKRRPNAGCLGSPGGRHVLMTAWWFPKKTKNFRDGVREQYKMIVWSRMIYIYICIYIIDIVSFESWFGRIKQKSMEELKLHWAGWSGAPLESDCMQSFYTRSMWIYPYSRFLFLNHISFI